MRSATLVFLALLGFCAHAQEGDSVVRPKLRMPGGRSYRNFSVSEKDLGGLGLDETQAIENKIKLLNDERGQLKAKLKAATTKVLAAQQELNQVLAQLDQQDAAFVGYLTTKLGEQKGKELELRLRLQPVIDWLELDDTQVGQLIQKQLQLGELTTLRNQIAQQARAAAAGDVPKTKEERAAKIELLKKYTDLNKQWLANIRGVIQDDAAKLKKFEQRYRRTRYSLEGGGM